MAPQTRQEEGGESRRGRGGETDRQTERLVMWQGSVCGPGGNASQLSRVQDQGSGEHRFAAVRCAPQALLETTTAQAPAAGLVGHATFSFIEKESPSSS